MANGTSQRVRNTMSMMTPEVFGAYAAKVDNLTASVAQLGSKFDDLATKIDARSRPQYNLVINAFTVILVVLGGIGSYLYIPLYTKVDAIARDTFATYMPKEIINEKIELVASAAREREKFYADAAKERSEQISARRDDWQRSTEARLNKDELAFETQRNALVGRSEHEQHWSQEKDEDANLQRQITDLNQNFKELFPLHDVIQNMQRKLEMLEDKGEFPSPQPKG